MSDEYYEGQTFRAVTPFSRPKSCKVHVMYVLKGTYEDEKLIVYRVYGRHRQWWHEKLCNNEQMDHYRQMMITLAS